jgi:phage anti-repressor protein
MVKRTPKTIREMENCRAAFAERPEMLNWHAHEIAKYVGITQYSANLTLVEFAAREPQADAKPEPEVESAPFSLPAVLDREIDGDLVQTVPGTELHAALNVGRHFTDWAKGRIQKYGLIEGVDFVMETRFPDLGSEMHGGQNKVEYHFVLDVAKELAMVENNEEGRRCRRYFIRMEREVKLGGSDPALYVLLNKLTDVTIEAKRDAAEAKSLASFEGERADRGFLHVKEELRHHQAEIDRLKAQSVAVAPSARAYTKPSRTDDLTLGQYLKAHSIKISRYDFGCVYGAARRHAGRGGNYLPTESYSSALSEVSGCRYA